MAVEANEKARSRRKNGSSGEMSFWVSGTEDPDAARDAALIEAPSTFGTLIPREADVVNVYERADDDLFEIKVTYDPPEKANDDATNGSVEYAFEFGTNNVNVKRALSTVSSHAPTGLTAPDFGGLINVDSSGNAQGVPVPMPTSAFSYTFKAPSSVVTQAYLDGVEALTFAPVNSGYFNGRPAGEVLFMGASGRQVYGEASYDFQITFRFKRRKNVTGIAIPGIDGTIDKQGWDYLWTYQAPFEDSANKVLAVRPKYAYVSRVIPRGSFSVLGSWVNTATS